MKQGRNIGEVLSEMVKLEKTKRDLKAATGAMSMTPDGQSFRLMDRAKNEAEYFGMTDMFHTQIAAALGIPVKYYRVMQEKKPDLLAENVNSWLSDKGSTQLVRTIDYGSGQTCRAFLSDRYKRIDNLSVAVPVLKQFSGIEGIEVASCEVTENRMYLKIVNHRRELEVVPGDVVQAGFMLQNSEVGDGAVKLVPLVYRLACTNGMVVNDYAERRRHVGRSSAQIEGTRFIEFSDKVLEAEDELFVMKLIEAANAAFSEAVFGQIVGRLHESTERPITGRLDDVVEVTSKNYGFTLDEKDGVLRHLIEGGDLSQYGLSNAVTRLSQDAESYDRATELEGVGWDIINLPQKGWREINGK